MELAWVSSMARRCTVGSPDFHPSTPLQDGHLPSDSLQVANVNIDYFQKNVVKSRHATREYGSVWQLNTVREALPSGCWPQEARTEA